MWGVKVHGAEHREGILAVPVNAEIIAIVSEMEVL